LVVGTSIDPHVAAVIDALPPDVVACRLDIDRYPREQQITLRPGGEPRVTLYDGVDRWCLDGCKTAWFRRLGQPGLDPNLKPELRPFALGEVEQTLTGALDLVQPQRWLNPYWSARRAAIKPSQYQIIRTLGIPFADTLITSSNEDARVWATAAQDGIVYKSLQSPVLEMPVNAPKKFVFSAKVSPSDLDDGKAIHATPCQFQHLVGAAFELRVTTIGVRHLTARIDHPAWGDNDAIDWRAHHGRLRYSTYELPEEVQQQLNRLMAELDLAFGASDWIVRPDGQHVLLEVNPHGAWLWLENELPELRISSEIAAFCVSEPATRHSTVAP
jgi:hypothetical protein